MSKGKNSSKMGIGPGSEVLYGLSLQAPLGGTRFTSAYGLRDSSVADDAIGSPSVNGKGREAQTIGFCWFTPT